MENKKSLKSILDELPIEISHQIIHTMDIDHVEIYSKAFIEGYNFALRQVDEQLKVLKIFIDKSGK